MSEENPDQYLTSDYSAVDRQIEEMASRESVLTQAKRFQNFRSLAITLAIIAGAISLIIISVGIALWFVMTPKIVEVETKIIEKHFIEKEVNHSITGNNFGSEGKIQNDTQTSEAVKKAQERLPEGKTFGTGTSAALIWDTYDDLDLSIVEPSGKKIFYSNRISTSGGVLDYDRNVADRTRTPVETIKWDNQNIPNGKYKIYVTFFGRDQREMGKSVSYIVTLILNGERKSFQAKFNKSDIKVNHLVHTFLVNR